MTKNFQAAEQVRQHTLSQKQTKFLNDQLKSVLAVDKRRGQLHSYEEQKAEKQRQLSELEVQEAEMIKRIQNTISKHK